MRKKKKCDFWGKEEKKNFYSFRYTQKKKKRKKIM